MKRKWMAVMLAFVLTLALAGCGNTGENTGASPYGGTSAGDTSGAGAGSTGGTGTTGGTTSNGGVANGNADDAGTVTPRGLVRDVGDAIDNAASDMGRSARELW